jgi:hypothetical protein
MFLTAHDCTTITSTTGKTTTIATDDCDCKPAADTTNDGLTQPSLNDGTIVTGATTNAYELKSNIDTLLCN